MKPAFDLKTHIDPQVSSSEDTLTGTSDIDGAAVDCQNYDGPISAVCKTGAATGGPSAQSHAAKLQESADGSTGWTDIVTQRTATLTADDSAVIITGNRSQRYVRTRVTSGFTGGTSPTNALDTVILGQKQNTSD